MVNTNIKQCVKFYEPSYADEGATIAVSSGDTLKDAMVNIDQSLDWVSSGSDDLTTEEITIELSEAQNIDAIYLVGINWQDYKIFYNTNQNFSNVETLDGSESIIDITNYDKSVAYFEFNEVSATNIKIQVFNTQVANAEKRLGYIAITKKIGQPSAFWVAQPRVRTDLNVERLRGINNKDFIIKKERTHTATLSWQIQSQTTTGNADVALFQNLSERQNSFLFWACGGRDDIFNLDIEGYRLRDIYLMQNRANVSPSWQGSTTTGFLTTTMNLDEVNV